jgi:hypothetical protein
MVSVPMVYVELPAQVGYRVLITTTALSLGLSFRRCFSIVERGLFNGQNIAHHRFNHACSAWPHPPDGHGCLYTHLRAALEK